jgi:seryl-tRNA synthetase
VEFVHTLNGTAIPLARALVVMIENFANEDGLLRVPEVLRPYLGGKEEI